jgi:hypothetical protein
MTRQLSRVDLRNANPQGRVDVLLYRILERMAPTFEQKIGLKGVWDAVSPNVHDLIVENVTPIKLAPEVKMLLTIMQANYPSGGIE